MSFNRPPNDINDMSTLKVAYKIDNETYYLIESVHHTAYILLLFCASSFVTNFFKILFQVDNLTFRTTPDQLRKIFDKYGDIGDIYIPRDHRTKESRGFAFVRFYGEDRGVGKMIPVVLISN